VSTPTHRSAAFIRSLALLAALGCGGRENGTGASASVTTETPAQIACDNFFAATSTYGCGGPSVPVSEIARVKLRFRQACENAVKLPGSGVTPEALEVCSAALNASSCQVVANSGGTILFANGLTACDFRGSLPGEATCNENVQCASGECLGARAAGPEGPAAPTCGTCAPALAVGQSCAPSGGCVPSAECTYGATNAVVCVAITYAGLGASCDSKFSLCNQGLSCNQQTGKCGPLPGNVGDSCTDFDGCARPLTCIGLGVPQTCQQPGSAGTSCSVDQDCAAGLGCVAVCTPVAWAMPGQPCDATKECLVGSCLSANGFGPPQPPDAAVPESTCPIVTPDGQPCGNGTCDTYSDCFKGVCTPTDSNVCR
jgi:hypothetical protein